MTGDGVAKQIGRNIAEARKQAGLSQYGLGLRLFMHPNEISRLERGVGCPRLTTLMPIARGLKVPLTDLLRGIE
jgi:transcriptional regulator with XRE-family HTH domain